MKRRDFIQGVLGGISIALAAPFLPKVITHEAVTDVSERAVLTLVGTPVITLGERFFGVNGSTFYEFHKDSQQYKVSFANDARAMVKLSQGSFLPRFTHWDVIGGSSAVGAKVRNAYREDELKRVIRRRLRSGYTPIRLPA